MSASRRHVCRSIWIGQSAIIPAVPTVSSDDAAIPITSIGTSAPRTPAVQAERKPFEHALDAWRDAKSRGDVDQLLRFYTPDFKSFDKTLAEWVPALRSEVDKVRGKPIQLKDLSYLRWTDAADTMVVTFGEVADGSRSGPTKRQYWIREGGEWKIFFEGIIG